MGWVCCVQTLLECVQSHFYRWALKWFCCGFSESYAHGLLMAEKMKDQENRVCSLVSFFPWTLVCFKPFQARFLKPKKPWGGNRVFNGFSVLWTYPTIPRDSATAGDQLPPVPETTEALLNKRDLVETTRVKRAAPAWARHLSKSFDQTIGWLTFPCSCYSHFGPQSMNVFWCFFFEFVLIW